MLKPFLASLAAAVFAAQAAHADAWSCQNSDLEISCVGGRCAVADGFTPMDVTIDLHTLSVCAYSGCWSGTAASMSGGKAFYAVGHDLRWSHDAQAPGVTFQIALDKSTGIAVLNGETYAHPMICAPVT